jgi:hypothetical protein
MRSPQGVTWARAAVGPHLRFAELFHGNPQLRIRVTADARRSLGAAYMHGHQLIGSRRYP